MIGTGADNTDVDPVSFVPSCIPVDDIDSVSCIEVIDGSFSVDFPDLEKAHVSQDQDNCTERSRIEGRFLPMISFGSWQ